MRTDSTIVNQQAADHDLELLYAAHQGNKYALAQLVSIFENGSPLGLRRRVALLTEIESQSEKYSMGFILGITGAPGTGKS
ncbi:MAG: hypothetical protein GY786_23535, partial [Proteobacteria bacterium]|nr:hypothetical protein [Pseudomonadota bacterium]